MKRTLRSLAIFLAANLMYEIAFPALAYALTGGPSQPEVQSFEPVGTTEMVDVSTGDFNYNIPLLDVEGYPINISYHGGVGMDQEASWVGLGWNINPGVINRNMRGLPDDFGGEKVEKTMSMAPNQSYGVITNIGLQLLGKEKQIGESLDSTFTSLRMNFTLGVSYNSYRGVGFELGVAPSINAGISGKTNFTAGLGLTANSQEGFGVEPSLSYSNRIGKNHGTADDPSYSKLGLSVSAPFNSRVGLKKLTYGISANLVADAKQKNGTNFSTDIGGVGSSISFGTHTYVPNIAFPMNTYNASFSATLGTSLTTAHPNGTLSGYIGEQSLKTNYTAKKAYGYLYTQIKDAEVDVLMDFNREKDGMFSENTNNLPVANYTFDLFSVSGQGIGAQYRPYRSDIGILFDDQMVSSSKSGSLGAEVGIGKDLHTGVNKGNNTTISTSGAWMYANKMSGATYAKDYRFSNKPLYEPAYFKNVGEHTPVDKDFYAIFGDNLPVRVGLDKDGGMGNIWNISSDNTVASRTLESTKGTKTELNANAALNVRQKRDKRNQMIQYLTAFEAAFVGLDKTINSYHPADINGNQQKDTHLRIMNTNLVNHRNHHLSEITALNPDGMRYVYGIPAYNNFTEEHTFNVAAPDLSNADCKRGLIWYDSIYMDYPLNNQGIDKFYSKTVTPQYAHSFLLTSVLSPDYVDVTGNGVTFDDDLGTAIKINYYLHDKDYQWRTPYGTIPYQAYYNEGQKSDKTDNKGSYIYGTKEIWYVSSIETKNYVAEFSFSDREDGLGAAGRHGGKGTTERLLKLDKITLYSKKDRQLHGQYATPVKTIYFEYDYSLCPDVDNNTRVNMNKNGTTLTGADTANAEINVNYYKGKLTLKKIYFSYGKSKKALLSPYQFYYSNYDPNDNLPDADLNPSYNIKAYDRWGNYKPNYDIINCGDSISTADFPYVRQDTASANTYAAAWSLTRINLPSGGQIRINYESDDYAYVQHKRAMQMFTLTGVGDVGYTVEGVPYHNFHRSDKLYEERDNHFYYVFFKLQQGFTSADAIKDYFRDEFRQYPGLIYFNFLIDLKDANQHYEYVRGYAELERKSDGEPECGVVEISGVPTGFFKVKDCPIGDRESSKMRVSPFVKTAWQFARTQRPELVYPGSDTKKGSESAIRGLLGALSEVTTLWKSFNRTLQNKDYGRRFIASKSWIRLYNPSFKKLGGGLRVKKLELSDRWQDMTGNSQVKSSSYGQEYEYTKKENIAGTIKTISSGVASYEPSIGNEENPWHQPIYTKVENLMAPDDKYYTEAPYGESFFPSPGVIYSKVTVKNLQHSQVTKHATGKIVHEFYTARDFPTIVLQTDIEKKRNKLNIPFPKEIEDYMTASQGYMIELNDMHGKPKAQWVYQEGKTNPISGVEYKYQITNENFYPYRLDNKVRAFDKEKNLIEEVQIATDIDFYMDSREHYTSSYNGTSEMNLDFITTPPVPLPMVWSSYASEKTRFRSLSSTKVVNKFGVLKKTIAYENGAKIETENVLYDAHTGEILLTRTQNEFKDSVFNFTYPAHFAYEGMGQAYKNIGALFNNVSLSKYNISLSGSLIPSDYFYPGDELLVINATAVTYKRGWIHKTGWGNLFVIDSVGKTIEGSNLTLKILRSGRRNLQNTPIAHSVSLKNPVVGDSLKFSATTQILDAGASLFSDQWGKYCNEYVKKTVCYDQVNVGRSNELFTVLNGLASAHKLTQFSNDSIGTFYDTSFFAENIQSQGCSTSALITHLYEGKTPEKGTSDDEFSMKGIFSKYEGGDPGVSCACSFSLYLGDSNTCITHFANFAYFLISCYEEDPCDTNYYYASNIPIDQISNFLTSEGISPTDTSSLSYSWNTPAPEDSCHWVHSFDSIVGFINDINSGGYYSIEYPSTAFSIKAIYSNGDTVLLSGKLDCSSNTLFTNCVSYCELITAGKTLNPYLAGIRGTWRKKKDFLYLTERTYGTSSISARKNGYYTNYNPYWKFDATSKPWKSDSLNWTWSNEVTKYSPQGFEIENRDALNRYSAALYADNNLPIAVGSNAKLKQIAYDGFEDLDYSLTGCKLEHWNFKNDLPGGVSIDTTISHTGIRSIKVNTSVSHLAARKIFDCSALTADTTGPEYKLQPCDCIDRFSPDTGYKYVLSGWIKDNIAATNTSYTAPSVIVELISGSGTSTLTFKASGNIIEGWQRVDTTFFIPYGTIAINIKLKASTANATWFDDLRIHPFNGNLKSYVYDPISLKLMSELDENNFATFYEYDEQGALIRVKKETERGIVTLKEARNSSFKLNP